MPKYCYFTKKMMEPYLQILVHLTNIIGRNLDVSMMSFVIKNQNKTKKD